jgi:alkyl hydroperoxide reductase subunit AhpC
MKNIIPKHEIFVKLQEIVNSKEGLWWKMRDLAKTHDYLIISDYNGKILKKLDVLEAALGPTEEITALRAAIAGQAA